LVLLCLGCGSTSSYPDRGSSSSVPVVASSIAPSSTQGRPNRYLGCIEISQRSTRIEAWDHSTIDGDIVSLIANGEQIARQVTLDGPQAKFSTSYTFANNGYNYLTLFAHNLGSISPNTAALSINGTEFVLEANLDTNGYVDVVVKGFGVSCGSGQSGAGGGGGSSSSGGGCSNACQYANDGECDDGGAGATTDACAFGSDCGDCGPRGGGSTGGGSTGGGSASPTTGQLMFWVSQDLGCGNISVQVSGGGSDTITGFYDSAPACGASASATFTLAPGTWSYSASCSSGTWSGSATVTAGGCSRMRLTP
jgi:hypothetical protein